jgi:glutamate synthase (NADPH/NADH) small chain
MTGGAEEPRDLEVPGHELDGIHFAMTCRSRTSAMPARRGTRGALQHHHRPRKTRRRGRRRRHSCCIGTSVRQGGVDHPARNPAAAAGAREQGADLWTGPEIAPRHRRRRAGERDWSVTTKRAIGVDGASRNRMRAGRMVRTRTVAGCRRLPAAPLR